MPNISLKAQGECDWCILTFSAISPGLLGTRVLSDFPYLGNAAFLRTTRMQVSNSGLTGTWIVNHSADGPISRVSGTTCHVVPIFVESYGIQDGISLYGITGQHHHAGTRDRSLRGQSVRGCQGRLHHRPSNCTLWPVVPGSCSVR